MKHDYHVSSNINQYKFIILSHPLLKGLGASLKGHRAGPLEMAKRGLWLEYVWSLMRVLKQQMCRVGRDKVLLHLHCYINVG